MYDFKFADIGEGIHEGQILRWFFKPGDHVKEGDTLVIIETDKISAEIPSPTDGIIVKLGGNEGDTIPVGATLVIINDGSKTFDHETKTVKENAGVVGEIEVSDEVIQPSTEPAISATSVKVLATPVARKMASDFGVDIKSILGTGEFGRVMKEDILQAAKRKQEPVVTKMEIPTENNQRVPITKLRKTIINAMVASKAMIPHTVLMEEINVSKLVEFRNKQRELTEALGIKLTFMPFIIKAVTLTIREYPIFNARYDHEHEEIVFQDNINIGIAVDTKDGLIVPNLKNADKKSILQLAKEVSLLAKLAIDRKLVLEQIQNGTFTITNYGAFDTSFGTPIIKYPEMAILGIGRIAKKPVVINNELTIGDVLPISLAVDHRIIDGGDAGRFIKKFKELITNPMLLLLS